MTYNMMFEENIFFNMAKKNANARQAYIDELDWKKHLPFVDSINYKKNNFLTKDLLMDNSVPIFYVLRTKFNIRFKHPSITVYSQSFGTSDVINNGFDFLHLLFNRQGYAAFELYLHKREILNYSPFAFDFRYWEFQGLLDAHRFETYALSTVNTKKNSSEYIQSSKKILSNIEDRISSNYFSLYKDGKSDFSQVLTRNTPIKKDPIFKI